MGHDGVGQKMRIELEVAIGATPERVWEAVTRGMDDWFLGEHGQALGLRLEPFPGGRLWRDLGDGAGHLWGHVQVYKPLMLLEIIGPLFESKPALQHLAFRIVPPTGDGAPTTLRFTHLATDTPMGESADVVEQLWTHILNERLKAYAERHAD